MYKSRSFHVCLFPPKGGRRRVGVGQRKDTSLIFFFFKLPKSNHQEILIWSSTFCFPVLALPLETKHRLVIHSNTGNGTERRTSDTISENVKGHTVSHPFSHQPCLRGLLFSRRRSHCVIRFPPKWARPRPWPRHRGLSHGSGQCRNSAHLTAAAVQGHSGGSKAGFSQHWRRGAPAACAQSHCNDLNCLGIHHWLRWTGLPSTPGLLQRGEEQHSMPIKESKASDPCPVFLQVGFQKSWRVLT